MHPVAVIIDYQDWQAIEKILEKYQKEDTTQSLEQYAGTINLTINPLEYQQHTRDEWL
jgi:hypothetical protein